MNARAHQGGVTLLELLVVMAIIALTASIAVLSIAPARGPAREEAERFAARIAAASQEALISGAPLSLDISPTEYRFMRYRRGEWISDRDTAQLAPRRIADNVFATIEIEDPALANEPLEAGGRPDDSRRIAFDPIGIVTPFAVDFADRRERWRVERRVDGMVVVRPHARP